MATMTVVATGATQWADSDTGADYGFGADPHLPVADRWQGWLSRAGILFPAIDWTGVGAVSQVMLELVNTDTQTHVERGSSPAADVKRITEKWKPNSATQHDSGGPPATEGSVYPGASTTSTNMIRINMPAGNGVRFSRNITELARAWAPSSVTFPGGPGKGAAMHGLALYPVTGAANHCEVKGYQGIAASDRPRLIITYTAAQKQPTPSPVSPMGPDALGTRYLFDSSAVITAYDLQVRTAGQTTTDKWNVVNSAAGIIAGGLSVDVTYAGTPLTTGAAYEWRTRGIGALGTSAWSAWVGFTHDPTAVPPDPYDQWASSVLSQLALPRVERDAGGLIPSGEQVSELLTLEYRERIALVDTMHVEPITRTLELLGMGWSVTYEAGWSADLAAHDIGTYTAPALELTED